MTPEPVAVIGAGSWGTALTKLLSDKGIRVSLWGHRKDHVDSIKKTRENATYLPGYKLNDLVATTSDMQKAVRGHKIIVMVVPSHVFREVFQNIIAYLEEDTTVVSAAKGIETETLMTMTQVMNDVLSANGKKANLAVLSGPSFAKEVAQGLPAAVTVAAASKNTAAMVQNVFFTDRFRVYASTDVIGVELGGPLKNIVAIAAGICDGLGYGTNARAALITRGLAEITRMGVKMGANPLTFSGLAGLGDLVLTCTGDLSRNRTVGLKLGKGKSLQTILGEMNMVAEGVKTTKSAWVLARKLEVEMPILEQVYQVLYENKPCSDAVQALMSRDQKEEIDFI